MALDTCNASVQRDVAGAQVAFDALSLDSYPGEDVTELATEALRLIHILSGSYSLPINLGTKLIKKVTKTSSEFFNRKMFALLDSARTLETKYRLCDPASMGNDQDYTSFGPYAICAALQDEHGKLIADSDWPALATKLPESNSTGDADDSKLLDKIQCYRCKQYGHKANNPICPLFSTRRSTGSGNNEVQEGPSDKRNKPKDPWKYIEPRDLTQPVEIDGRKWYYCTKCKCRATGKVGFYQLSHTDATHDPNWRPESNSTPIADPDSTPVPPLRPSDLAHALDNDLVFTGVNLAPVIIRPSAHDEREMVVQRALDAMVGQNLEGQKVCVGSGQQHIVDTTSVSMTSASEPVALWVPVEKSCAKEKSKNCLPSFPSGTEGRSFSEFVPTSNTLRTRDDKLLTSVSVFWNMLLEFVITLWVYVYHVVGTVILWFEVTKYFLRTTSTSIALTASTSIVSSEFYIWWLFLLGIGTLEVQALLFSVLHISFWFECFFFVRGISYEARTVVTGLKQGTKLNSVGFPAKWLIFTAVMFSAQFWPSTVGYPHYLLITMLLYLILGVSLVGSFITRQVHVKSKTYLNWLIELNFKLINKICNIVLDWIRPSFPLKLLSRTKNKTERLNNTPRTTHVINTVTKLSINTSDEYKLHVAPAISEKAEQEVFTSLDLEVNLLANPLYPVIFDTGASLSITGDKEDFLLDSFKETSQLKLGGMASGASITGVGNVAWTFPCKNNDHMTVIMKCYLVPKASTRLLSPQCIFDKQNGHPGKFWGDEEQFQLEYDDKPAINVGYSTKSNLPIGYAISTSQNGTEPMVNLSLLNDENQNLTAGQKLLHCNEKIQNFAVK